MIKIRGIKVNGEVVCSDYFPDGTHHFNVIVSPSVDSNKNVCIHWHYEPNEEMTLFYLVKHLRNQLGCEKISLYMPYIPNARMDRVKKSSEVFTLKYFCEFINALNFEQVVVMDAHSNVSLALIDRVVDSSPSYIIGELVKALLKPDRDVVVYPDEGAVKRYSGLIKFPYLFGNKKRNWDDGKIVGLDIEGNSPNGTFNCLIVDDICCYGGTFLHTARKLKELGAGKIWLYVTHCENSILKGDLIDSGLLEKIYTTDSIFTGKHDLIHVFSL